MLVHTKSFNQLCASVLFVSKQRRSVSLFGYQFSAAILTTPPQDVNLLKGKIARTKGVGVSTLLNDERDDIVMAASNPASSEDLAAQVAMFAQKMDGMLDWILSQANPTVKDNGDKRIAAKDKEPSSFTSETGLSKTHHDDNNDDATKLMAQARLQPF